LRDSLDEYDKALELDRTDAKIHYNRGNTNLAMGKNRDAHEDFDKAISITSTNSKFFHSKGLAYQDAEDYDNAIKQFEMALDISPEHVPSIFHLGLMQHKKGKLNDSLESFT